VNEDPLAWAQPGANKMSDAGMDAGNDLAATPCPPANRIDETARLCVQKHFKLQTIEGFRLSVATAGFQDKACGAKVTIARVPRLRNCSGANLRTNDGNYGAILLQMSGQIFRQPL
jgi:hypothetical protein